jgi:hypothetical protein
LAEITVVAIALTGLILVAFLFYMQEPANLVEVVLLEQGALAAAPGEITTAPVPVVAVVAQVVIVVPVPVVVAWAHTTQHLQQVPEAEVEVEVPVVAAVSVAMAQEEVVSDF